MFFNKSFMGRASAPPSAHAKGQIKRGQRGQQWYGRPAEVFSTTNLVISIRLEELLVRSARANPVPKNRGLSEGGRAKRWFALFRKNHPGRKRRALPELEGLLE